MLDPVFPVSHQGALASTCFHFGTCLIQLTKFNYWRSINWKSIQYRTFIQKVVYGEGATQLIDAVEVVAILILAILMTFVTFVTFTSCCSSCCLLLFLLETGQQIRLRFRHHLHPVQSGFVFSIFNVLLLIYIWVSLAFALLELLFAFLHLAEFLLDLLFRGGQVASRRPRRRRRAGRRHLNFLIEKRKGNSDQLMLMILMASIQMQSDRW